MVEAPQEINQMCRNIKKLAQPFKGGPHLSVQTNARESHLHIIVEYCKAQHYSKTTNSIPHPLRSNRLEDNLLNQHQKQEFHHIKHLQDDFQQLKQLMAASKLLGCEPLYELCAASIASWFRQRTIRDVFQKLHIELNYPYAYQLQVDQIKVAKEKFHHFISKIDYPQMQYQQYKLQQQQRAAQMQQQLQQKDELAAAFGSQQQQQQAAMMQQRGQHPQMGQTLDKMYLDQALQQQQVHMQHQSALAAHAQAHQMSNAQHGQPQHLIPQTMASLQPGAGGSSAHPIPPPHGNPSNPQGAHPPPIPDEAGRTADGSTKQLNAAAGAQPQHDAGADIAQQKKDVPAQGAGGGSGSGGEPVVAEQTNQSQTQLANEQAQSTNKRGNKATGDRPKRVRNPKKKNTADQSAVEANAAGGADAQKGGTSQPASQPQLDPQDSPQIGPADASKPDQDLSAAFGGAPQLQAQDLPQDDGSKNVAEAGQDNNTREDKNQNVPVPAGGGQINVATNEIGEQPPKSPPLASLVMPASLQSGSRGGPLGLQNNEEILDNTNEEMSNEAPANNNN